MLVLQLGYSISTICIHGYNQAWPHASSYEIVGDYQNHVGDCILAGVDMIGVLNYCTNLATAFL